MVTMQPADARDFWKSLMDNASSLIADARLLFDAQSYGRARSLTVLAQEELGKALWIYDEFQTAWSTGDESPREAGRLAEHGRSHVQKYLEAFVFGDQLALFWGDYSNLGQPQGESGDEYLARQEREAEHAARQANSQKQAGFYVDRSDQGSISSPTEVAAGDIEAELQTAAQVVEMLLIQDHSRMKMYAQTPYDSTHEQQFRLLPIAHPEEWATASDEFKRDSQPSGERET